MCNAFPLTHSVLVWKIGNGASVRIGGDPWPGSQQSHLLPGQLVLLLQQKGFFHLNQIVDHATKNIWHQGCLGSWALEIQDIWFRDWNRYITALLSSHI